MDTSRDFAVLAALVSRRLRSKFKEHLPAGQLTPNAWIVLLWMANAGGRLTQRQLGEMMDLSDGPLSRLIQSLEDQGYVTREPSEFDLRTKVVRLMPASDVPIAIGEQVGKRLREKVFANIAEEDLKTALNVLRTLTRRLK